MPGHIKVSGVWKEFSKMHVKVSGTWKEVQNGYVKVSGAWKEFFVNAVVTVSGEIITETGSSPSAGVRFNTDGTIDKYTNEDGGSPVYTQIDSSTDWIVPNGAASDATYHLRATLNAESGGGTKTGTLGSWLELNTARQWDIERLAGAGSGTSTWDLDIEISDDGGTTTIDTGLFEHTSIII